MTQPDLPIITPSVDPDVRWLEQLLLDAHTWMTAGDIGLTTRGRVTDRDIRALASASALIISGQKSFLHIEHATAGEIAHASNWLVSQGKGRIKRVPRIRRNAHGRIG